MVPSLVLFINHKPLRLKQQHNGIKMIFNNKQKRTAYLGLLIMAAAFLVWIGFGGEIFTKTQVLVEKQDELFNITYKEWKEQFVLGLDYTLGVSGIISLVFSALIWKQRTKKLKSS